MDISEMTSSNVSEMHQFPICPFPISLFSDKPPFLPAPKQNNLKTEPFAIWTALDHLNTVQVRFSDFAYFCLSQDFT